MSINDNIIKLVSDSAKYAESEIKKKYSHEVKVSVSNLLRNTTSLTTLFTVVFRVTPKIQNNKISSVTYYTFDIAELKNENNLVFEVLAKVIISGYLGFIHKELIDGVSNSIYSEDK